MRLRSVIPALAVAAVLWAVATTYLFIIHHDDRPARADAVVVLAGTKERLPEGLKLMEEGYAPLLVLSKPQNMTWPYIQACSGRLPYRVECFDAEPYSTRGEARFIGSLARRGVKSVDVVTSQFHITRARILIRRCFHGDLHMVGAPQTGWKVPYYAFFESLKLVYEETVIRTC